VLHGLIAVIAALAAAGGPGTPRAEPERPPTAVIRWSHSVSLGKPGDGRLVGGVRFPAEGRYFFTWDPVLLRSPDRWWRRYGNDRLVSTVLDVIGAYARAHPEAPRVGIGDLSRPRGGDFGHKHATHQNGLDVDVYFPRRDRRERSPHSARQIDRRLAQDLLNRFVRAGAVRIFIGPNTHLRGPRRIVRILWNHDNHMHVRIAAHARSAFPTGRSALGRPIGAIEVGDPLSPRRALVVGCIHGDECAGLAVTRILLKSHPNADLWIVPNLNPDGFAARHRENARGVDLNRNFSAGWQRGRASGPYAFSEPETGFARALIRRLHPSLTIWFHQPQGLVRAWGRSVPAARRYAVLTGVPFRRLRWPPGSAPQWQNRRFRRGASYVVELPPGRLSTTSARRYAGAVLTAAESTGRAPSLTADRVRREERRAPLSW
jgi:murein peptide amidase A